MVKKKLPQCLIEQLHPTLNGGINKINVAGGSKKKLWWICKQGHEWKDSPSHRYGEGRGCPYCSGKRVCKGNCLQTINPKLAKEWNKIKNGELTVYDVTSHSGKKVWWKCEKGHEWEAKIYSRQNGRGCPFCSGKKAGIDNCLAIMNPNLAKELHPIKNENNIIYNITKGSNKKVWWICKKGHEWEASVKNRNKGDGCPYCANQKVCIDNCLANMNPTLAREWHPTKNGNLTPYDLTSNSHSMVWWVCKKGHEWQATPNKRNKRGCPYCCGNKVNIDNCLATICPELIEEWHSSKNGNLTPHNLTSSSQKKVWWKCKKGHEWQASVSNRKRGTKCPKCSNSTSYPDKFIFYCLSVIFGEESVFLRKKIKTESGMNEVDCYIKSIDLCIAYDGWFYHKEKHKQDYDKGEKIVATGSKLVVIREYPLPSLGIDGAMEFFIEQRAKEKKFGRVILEIIEELINKYPEIDKLKLNIEALKNNLEVNDDIRLEIESKYLRSFTIDNSIDKFFSLSKEWNYEKNNGLKPSDFTYGSNVKVWWKCPKCDFEWKTTIKYRSSGGGKCPRCCREKNKK